MEGWIKLHRRITEWEWFDDDKLFKLFIYLLIKANHENGGWHGINIERGQLITSRERLANELHYSEQQVRTMLLKLQKTKEITTKSTNKYTIITICNYDNYQIQTIYEQPTNEPTNNQQITSNQPTNNQQITTNKNDNNNNNENNVENIISAEKSAQRTKPTIAKEPKKNYGEYQNVTLTDSEAQKLRDEFGNDALAIVQNFSALKAMKGYKYKSDYLAIRKWGASAYYETLNKNNYGTANNQISTERISELSDAMLEYERQLRAKYANQ